jgi:hypothetical protein
MCLYNQKEYNEAIAAFRAAGETQRSSKIARQWISVIESDIERNKQIQLAENAARKQAAQLEERRRSTDRS